MSEFDTDSDWLDISSNGRDSDNDSLASHDSDRDISRPHSRSSFSGASSVNGEVDAWEGLIPEVIDAAEAHSGMHPQSQAASLHAQSLHAGLTESANQEPLPEGHKDEEEQRVREALDQSFVGTLSASRSSASAHSAHTSTRDIRLSFPDPLTSSRDELNRSFEAISSSETAVSSLPDSDVDESAELITSPPLHDPGIAIPTPAVQHHEVEPIVTAGQAELEIVLYGSSSSQKWKFVQELAHKAATFSGYASQNTLQLDEDGITQTLHFIKGENDVLHFFDVITIHDKTGEPNAKFEIDGFENPNRLSLAVVYLPTAKLPILALHTAYLPVLVPADSGQDSKVLMQAAEDDWELLGVPARKVSTLTHGTSPVFNAQSLPSLYGRHAYDLLQDLYDEVEEPFSKPLTEQLKSVNAVKLFALVSIMVGFAVNTAFQPSAPSPTPTVNAPSNSNNSNLWGILAPHNQSAIITQANTSAKCNHAVIPNYAANNVGAGLSVYNAGATSLSVSPPPTAKSLTITPSPSKALAEIPTTSKCFDCKVTSSSSSENKAKVSTDIVFRPVTPTSLSEVRMQSPVPLTVTSNSNGGTLLVADPRAGPSNAKATGSCASVVNSVSEVIDAGVKAVADVMGTDINEVLDAADGLLSSVFTQTENIIKQSKGKARAINEEVASRNGRAKKRAKELKKKGEDFVSYAGEQFWDRTARAKKRARDIGKTVLESEPVQVYQKAQDEWREKLTKKERRAQRKVAGAEAADKENNAHNQRRCSRHRARRGECNPPQDHGFRLQFAF